MPSAAVEAVSEPAQWSRTSTGLRKGIPSSATTTPEISPAHAAQTVQAPTMNRIAKRRI